MKMWNCFMMDYINGELGSVESYGIFSSLEEGVENILKAHQVGHRHKEADDEDDVCWFVDENKACFFVDGVIHGWDITLRNICNSKEEETVFFHLERHEVDKG